MGCSHKPRNVGGHQKLEEEKNELSPRASGGIMTLSTPGFEPRDIEFRFLASKAMKK